MPRSCYTNSSQTSSGFDKIQTFLAIYKKMPCLLQSFLVFFNKKCYLSYPLPILHSCYEVVLCGLFLFSVISVRTFFLLQFISPFFHFPQFSVLETFSLLSIKTPVKCIKETDVLVVLLNTLPEVCRTSLIIIQISENSCFGWKTIVRSKQSPLSKFEIFVIIILN